MGELPGLAASVLVAAPAEPLLPAVRAARSSRAAIAREAPFAALDLIGQHAVADPANVGADLSDHRLLEAIELSRLLVRGRVDDVVRSCLEDLGDHRKRKPGFVVERAPEIHSSARDRARLSTPEDLPLEDVTIAHDLTHVLVEPAGSEAIGDPSDAIGVLLRGGRDHREITQASAILAAVLR